MSTVKSKAIAADVRARVFRSRNRFWRPEDFDGSPDAVAKALSRLTESGELRRIRRGLYWRGTSTPLGMAPPPADSLASTIVGEPGVGPAGLSAALMLGLSTQVPRVETIAVPKRPPRDTDGIHFVGRNASTGRRDERLAPAEVALLEVLRDWSRVVEVTPPEAIERIDHMSSVGSIRMNRVVRASSTEPPSTRERLRSLLSELNRTEDARRVPQARSYRVRNELSFAG